jgi:hypothetical protein
MFNTLKTLFINKTPSEQDIQKINSFVMLRWLSNDKQTSYPANILNIYSDIPIDIQYKFLKKYFKITGVKNKFIKYPKDEKLPEELEKLYLNIQKYYNVNRDIAKKYFELMDDEQRDRLYNMYNEGLV